VTPADLLRRELSRDGARPLLTWYDDDPAESARIELSVATTANWVAKLAGFLTDEHDIESGVAVRVELPLHWQTACVLLAIWSCGAAVTLDADADLTIGTSPDGDVVLAVDPMGVGLSQLVAAQPDVFMPPVPVDAGAPALHDGSRGWTHGELGDAAAHAALHHHIDDASRVLTTMAFDSVDGIDAGLLAPLAAGASAVLVRNADPARLAQRCATENVTHTAGVAVAELARLD
jgi:uncharacterized protein (TIGR03089 family)